MSILKRWKCLVWAWKLFKNESSKFTVVGNRIIITGMVGTTEITITQKDTTQPDGYSREELYQMHSTIRREEIRQKWKVPEPRCTEIGKHHSWEIGFPPTCADCGETQGTERSLKWAAQIKMYG